MRLLKPGPLRQWNPIRRQNWNNRFQHFQIQPIKCPVQNNEISTCSLTCDVYATTVSVKCQAQTSRTFMCVRLRNNFMLHSVYFRSLIDLENKSCVRVSLVIILPECKLNHYYRNGLKKSFKWFVSSFTRTTFTRHLKGFFQDSKIFKPYIRHSDDIYLRVALLHNSSFLNQPVA